MCAAIPINPPKINPIALTDDTARKFEEHFTQKGRQQGIAQGLLRAKRETAAKLLLLKFGPDDTRAAWMEALSAAQLDLLTKLLLSTDDETALRAKIDAHRPG
jgi:hypothetical protein